MTNLNGLDRRMYLPHVLCKRCGVSIGLPIPKSTPKTKCCEMKLGDAH